MTPLKYGLLFDDRRRDWVCIEATKYHEVTKEPTQWAIRSGSNVLSKKTGLFEYEPSSSNRDEAFFKEFRFESAGDALLYWRSLRQIIL